MYFRRKRFYCFNRSSFFIQLYGHAVADGKTCEQIRTADIKKDGFSQVRFEHAFPGRDIQHGQGAGHGLQRLFAIGGSFGAESVAAM